MQSENPTLCTALFYGVLRNPSRESPPPLSPRVIPMAEAAAATTAPAPAKGGSTKLLLIILIVLLLVGMGGGAAWFFLGGGNHAASGPAAPPKPKQPVFVAMETLTVNLQPEEGNDRYLQIGITFKSFDKHAEEEIKTYTPELRSKVLMLLASKTPTELYPADGKVKLAKEIVELCEHVFKAVGKESPVADVLFTNFVIQ